MAKLGLFTFFSGAGFLDLGFETAGFTSLFANELFDDFCQVYKYSREKMKMEMPKFGLQEKDINAFLTDKADIDFLHNALSDSKKEFDFVGFIGGPPCPDFSVAGKNRGEKGEHGKLSQSYVNLICREKPDFFVFENVKGLWRTSQHRAFFDKLVNQVQTAGYSTTARLINAMEYGAPQDRDRIILIGVRDNIQSYKNHVISDFEWCKYVSCSMEKIKNIPWPRRSCFCENKQIDPPDNIIPELTIEYWFRKNDVEHHPNKDNFFVPRAGLPKMKLYDEGDDSKKCYKRPHRWRYSPTAAYGNNEVQGKMDTLSKEKRSWNMSRIKSEDTVPETAVLSLSGKENQ